MDVLFTVLGTVSGFLAGLLPLGIYALMQNFRFPYEVRQVARYAIGFVIAMMIASWVPNLLFSLPPVIVTTLFVLQSMATIFFYGSLLYMGAMIWQGRR